MLDLPTFLRALPAGCPLSVEVQSDRLSATLRPVERAVLVRDATRAVLGGPA